MKLVRFGNPGQEKPGIVDSDGRIRDLSAVVPDIAGDVLSAKSLERLRGLDLRGLPLVASDVRLGPCVGNVGNFLAVGLNYADHAAESGMAVPDEPVVFNKWTSCICGPDDDIQIPRGSTKTDWEVELGIVIGDIARDVSEDEALAHVAG